MIISFLIFVVSEGELSRRLDHVPRVIIQLSISSRIFPEEGNRNVHETLKQSETYRLPSFNRRESLKSKTSFLLTLNFVSFD